MRRSSAYEDRAAQASRDGFFKWLKRVGLAEVVKKLATWTWERIKGYFGF